MSKEQKKVEMVPLSQIVADEHQPRKNFNPDRLAELIKSIKRYGIMNPLIVEKVGASYLLEDGERRFRAATEIGLKEVPVIVVPAKNSTERLLSQFHLQEQHEGWSPLEKAIAVTKLADEFGVGVEKLAEMLSLNSRTIGDYIAFGKLLDKKEFVKNEISIKHAGPILRLRTFARGQYRKIEEEFTQDQEKDLEKALVARIKEGTMTRTADFARIRDSLRVDPKSIEKFIKNAKVTAEKLFKESNAKVGFHFRNIVSFSNGIVTHVRAGLPLKVESYFDEDATSARSVVKSAHAELGRLLNKIS